MLNEITHLHQERQRYRSHPIFLTDYENEEQVIPSSQEREHSYRNDRRFEHRSNDGEQDAQPTGALDTPFSWLEWLDTLRTRDSVETTGSSGTAERPTAATRRPVEFAKALKKRLHGILGHCRWRPHTSVIESINKKIKVTKRMVYGHPG